MALTTNKTVLSWIEEQIELVKPDKVVWIDGSKEQIEALRAEACATGEIIKLNEELLSSASFTEPLRTMLLVLSIELSSAPHQGGGRSH